MLTPFVDPGPNPERNPGSDGSAGTMDARWADRCDWRTAGAYSGRGGVQATKRKLMPHRLSAPLAQSYVTLNIRLGLRVTPHGCGTVVCRVCAHHR